MPVKSNVPIRICGSKTRTGCKTCKQRHVKCDETKPICLRCRKATRQCIYEVQQDISACHPPRQDTRTVPTVTPQNHTWLTSHTLGNSISPFGPRMLREVGAVKHFGDHLSKELNGAFSDHVWSYTIPLVAQQEPSIWYAMSAIGMLDADLRNGENMIRKTAIKLYDRAIRELHKRLMSLRSTQQQDVVLLSCLLLAVFECLQNNVQSALRHIGGGMKLLIQWEHERQSKPERGEVGYLNRGHLLPIFLSLDSQAIQMSAIEFRHHGSLPVVDAQLDNYSQFASIEEAHLSLNYIFNRMSHWAIWQEPRTASGWRPSDEWMISERQGIEAQYSKWDSSFSNIPHSSEPAPATFLLLVQRKVLQAFFRKESDGPYSELEWDKHLSLFQEAVQDAEIYISCTQESRPEHEPNFGSHIDGLATSKSTFVLSMDLVMPLFMISTRCRDAKVRRRALRILQTCNRKEGIWDSYHCSILASQIIALEEAAALEDGFIPEDARIFDIDVRLDEEKVVSIIMRKRIRNELDGQCIEIQEVRVL